MQRQHLFKLQRNYEVIIDVTGQFATASYQHRYNVVIMDYYLKFPEVLITNLITSFTIIKWLKEIFAKHKNPDIIVSNNGTNSMSEDFENFFNRQIILENSKL